MRLLNSHVVMVFSFADVDDEPVVFFFLKKSQKHHSAVNNCRKASPLTEEIGKIGRRPVNACPSVGVTRDQRSRECPTRLTTSLSHFFRHARNAERRSTSGASLAREDALSATNSKASVLHLPPVSSATTTSRHRSLATSSAYLASSSRRACDSAAPLTVAAVARGAPTEVTALRCAPWWRPAATTSISRSSVAETCTFVSSSLTLRVNVAPASRHTRAKVLSVGTARLFNLPECGQAARCLPKMSFWPPHSHLASVKSNGRHNLSNTSVRKCMGCTWNSGPVGEPWKTAPNGTASEPGRRRMI